MSKVIGPVAWGGTETALAGDRGEHQFSEETAHTIDSEVERLLKEQQERARSILAEHRDALEAVASALIDHETLDGATVARIVEEHPPTRA
jgi:cell division protease FtsH